MAPAARAPQRQLVLVIVGEDAHVLHWDAVFVENTQKGEAVDDQHPRIAYASNPQFLDDPCGGIQRSTTYSVRELNW